MLQYNRESYLSTQTILYIRGYSYEFDFGTTCLALSCHLDFAFFGNEKHQDKAHKLRRGKLTSGFFTVQSPATKTRGVTCPSDKQSTCGNRPGSTRTHPESTERTQLYARILAQNRGLTPRGNFPI